MNDYIKRDKALKELHLNHKDVIYIDKRDTAKRIEKIQGIDLADYVPKDFHDKTCEAMAKAHQEEIADMVRVADRPQGEWIEVDDDLISCRCSVCGWEAHLYEDDVYGMPYCPNCGARMKGADDE